MLLLRQGHAAVVASSSCSCAPVYSAAVRGKRRRRYGRRRPRRRPARHVGKARAGCCCLRRGHRGSLLCCDVERDEEVRAESQLANLNQTSIARLARREGRSSRRARPVRSIFSQIDTLSHPNVSEALATRIIARVATKPALVFWERQILEREVRRWEGGVRTPVDPTVT